MCVDERIGFGLLNRGSDAGVSVFWLRWCKWDLDHGLEGWGDVMSV